jgi:hypothetical protein
MCATASDIKNQQERNSPAANCRNWFFFCFWVFSFFSSVSKQTQNQNQNQKKKTQTPPERKLTQGRQTQEKNCTIKSNNNNYRNSTE